ncbi:hypothetical protein Taro_017209 [Colocasia esculenta]|uniref:Uncharacterized protein n=1 Tax=Colocasia esculenta TaxID=4460 RepID=A0A843UMK0_COLES|nr:hypothetical protein [Colocasia esculenta]
MNSNRYSTKGKSDSLHEEKDESDVTLSSTLAMKTRLISFPHESYVQPPSNNSGFYYPRVQSPSRTLTHPSVAGLLFTTRRGIQHPGTQVFLHTKGKLPPVTNRPSRHTRRGTTQECVKDRQGAPRPGLQHIPDLRQRLRVKDLQSRKLSELKDALQRIKQE